MPKDLLKENVAIGQIIYEWWLEEYEQYDHSRRWYLVAMLVFAALFAWMWLAEGLTWTAALGGAMVVVAVVLSEWSASGNAPSKAAA